MKTQFVFWLRNVYEWAYKGAWYEAELKLREITTVEVSDTTKAETRFN